jgi:hypothetical protein
MAEMGSIGGKIGGKRRAEKMSPEARKASALLAARARWAKTETPEESIEMKREQGLQKIARILEQHMTDMGLDEGEKNEKTMVLISVVNEMVTAKMKAPAKHG